jgi:hypothetical protein
MPAPLRFLFVGRFTSSPSGQRVTVSGERMADVMARLDLKATVEIPDHLGTAPVRRYEVELGSARALRAADVVAATEPLRALTEIATALVRPGGALGLDDAIAKVRALVGDGPLVTALAALQPTSTATPPAAANPSTAAPAPAPSSGSAALDAIFSQADIAQPDVVAAARSGLDAFIGAMRKGKPAAAGKPTQPAHRASVLLLDACEATAAEVLAAEPAAAIEVAWRGLKMVLAESPGHARLAIELLDTTSLAALGDAIAAQSPDAIFMLESPTDLAGHGDLAAIAAEHRVPVVAPLSSELLDAGASPLSAWVALRRNEATQWLCAVTNDVVLAAETTRVGPRVVFGPSVFAVAAMLAASLRRDGTFGDAFGRAGVLVAPAVWVADASRGSTRNLPTRASLVPDAMRTLFDAGIAAMGVEPGGERLLAVGAPMVAAAEGPSLPGRILVGRAVRAATAAKAELVADPGAAAVQDALLRAAATVLPDGPPGACTLRGTVNGRDLDVVAELSAHAVGRPVRWSFRV